jgi:hypothetical protein
VHTSIKAIACVYALLAVALVAHWAYAVLFIGTWDMSDFLVALGLLGLAHGLVTFRPWARTIGLLISGLLGSFGVFGLILWLGVNLHGDKKGWTGLIVDRPVAALILAVLPVAFSAWQWWVLSRPQVRRLYSSMPV